MVPIETSRQHFKVHLKWKTSAILDRKHCEKKEKLLDTRNFSFSHNVFLSYISIVHQNAALCGNGLIKQLLLPYVALNLSRDINQYQFNPLLQCPNFYQPWRKKAFETLLEKGKMLVSNIFSFSPYPAFSTFQAQITSFMPHIICCLPMLSNWTNLKLCHFGIELSSNEALTAKKNHYGNRWKKNLRF